MLRNPFCGWVLYLDAVAQYPKAETYWAQLDPWANRASGFYHRARWSDYEPEEGRFAWRHDANFISMLSNARARGLRLSFRVLVNSRDNAAQATPDYVRQAGAKGYEEKGRGGSNLWCPSPSDPIFQAKFEKFLIAFGQAFDDPVQVDLIDGNCLGYWGEAHHLGVDESERAAVLNWMCGAYGMAFKKVLLAIPLGGDFGLELNQRVCLEQFGYLMRRDGLGSSWFSPPEKKMLLSIFPPNPLVGESCYFSVKTWIKPYSREKGVSNYLDILSWTLLDALEHHANTLDLRAPVDAKTWIEDAPELVARFTAEGGYRLSPVEILFPKAMSVAHPVTVKHHWTNAGAGILPNSNLRWAHKYRVAFSLWSDLSRSPEAVFVDLQTNPGDWIKGKINSNECRVFWPVGLKGRYQLAAAIVDVSDKRPSPEPAIQLAVLRKVERQGWLLLGGVELGP